MKKINFLLLLCFGISCISYAQIASLSGNSEVEVGIANTYTVTLDSIPAGYSVVSYIWAVDYEGPMGHQRAALLYAICNNNN